MARRFAVRATVAYKGSWTRRIRTFSRDDQDAPAIRRADGYFSGILRNSADPSDRAAEIGAESIEIWREAPQGTRPLVRVAERGTVLTMHLTVDGLPWCGAGLLSGQ